MTTLILGPGGAGHTYFMTFLSNSGIQINNIDDNDTLKHLSYPNIEKLESNNIIRCIFLYNNPLLCILSLFRRKYQYLQINKLGNPFKLNTELNDDDDIDKFLMLTKEKGCDIFGIKYQFDNWINNTLDIPVLFLDFNDILKEKEMLNRFIDKELDYNNFKIQERESIINNDLYNDLYNDIYNDLYNDIKLKSSDYNKKYLVS